MQKDGRLIFRKYCQQRRESRIFLITLWNIFCPMMTQRGKAANVRQLAKCVISSASITAYASQIKPGCSEPSISLSLPIPRGAGMLATKLPNSEIGISQTSTLRETPPSATLMTPGRGGMLVPFSKITGGSA